jgi:hypothetical protein
LETGLGIFLNSKRIFYINNAIVYDEPKWGFRRKWFEYGPNVLFEVSRNLYQGYGPINSVRFLIRSEYHFRTFFLNTSVGLKIKIN